MKPKLKITIPEPCNENWDKMTPDAAGRFCLVCNKSVIDFTNKLPDEIQHFFKNNKDPEVCGRFKKSQLDSISFQIPKQVLYSQTQYHKMFLLALFIAMGTTLFSCASKNGKKQRISHVELIDDDSQAITPTTEKFTSNKTHNKSTKDLPLVSPLCKNSFILGGGRVQLNYSRQIEKNVKIEEKKMNGDTIKINNSDETKSVFFREYCEHLSSEKPEIIIDPKRYSEQKIHSPTPEFLESMKHFTTGTPQYIYINPTESEITQKVEY